MSAESRFVRITGFTERHCSAILAGYRCEKAGGSALNPRVRAQWRVTAAAAAAHLHGRMRLQTVEVIVVEVVPAMRIVRLSTLPSSGTVIVGAVAKVWKARMTWKQQR